MHTTRRLRSSLIAITLASSIVFNNFASAPQTLYAQDEQAANGNKTYLPIVSGNQTNVDTVGINQTEAQTAETASIPSNDQTTLWSTDETVKGNLPDASADSSSLSEAEKTAMYTQYIDDLYTADSVVSTFSTSYGDTIDCVEIEAQPSLRHTGIARTAIPMQPTTLPTDANDSVQASSVSQVESNQSLMQMEGNSCVAGSIPILRLTVDRLRNFKDLGAFRRKYADDRVYTGNVSVSAIEPPRVGSSASHQYAVARRDIANLGAESFLNLWAPYTEKSSEFSLSQIWVTRGTGADLETVEAGWQKYRDLYGDWNPRLFIYFTPDNYGSRGCYNLTCSGFVQVNNSVVIGGRFSNYSVANGTQYDAGIGWYKDGTTGHWWLRYNGNIWVGYYPRSLFDSRGLSNSAAQITFGGEIVDGRTGGRHTQTDMGSGYWPYQGFRWAAYQRRVQYFDTSRVTRSATGLYSIITDRWCYDISLRSSSDTNWNQYFYFGGSGYNTECQ